jgi:hypothetical protein
LGAVDWESGAVVVAAGFLAVFLWCFLLVVAFFSVDALFVSVDAGFDASVCAGAAD